MYVQVCVTGRQTIKAFFPSDLDSCCNFTFLNLTFSIVIVVQVCLFFKSMDWVYGFLFLNFIFVIHLETTLGGSESRQTTNVLDK